MTKKTDERNVFMKFEMDPILKRDFKDACKYFDVTMTEAVTLMAEAMVDEAKRNLLVDYGSAGQIAGP